MTKAANNAELVAIYHSKANITADEHKSSDVRILQFTDVLNDIIVHQANGYLANGCLPRPNLEQDTSFV